MKDKAIFCWSGGKDSALALYQSLANDNHEIISLLTTVTEDYDRISMHGVRRILLEEQALALLLPLEKVFILKNDPPEEYERKMKSVLRGHQLAGVTAAIFGDIFLEGIRKYREDNLLQVGMKGVFPLWEKDTAMLARRFIALGFKAIVTCVDTKVLDGKFAGREFDGQFLSELPPDIDPSGENGEFHSFVYDGPIFQKKVLCEKGETVLRDNRFCYCDLKPLETHDLSHRL